MVVFYAEERQDAVLGAVSPNSKCWKNNVTNALMVKGLCLIKFNCRNIILEMGEN